VCTYGIELVVLVQLDNPVDNGMRKPHDLAKRNGRTLILPSSHKLVLLHHMGNIYENYYMRQFPSEILINKM
jgi:hypothetical protein